MSSEAKAFVSAAIGGLVTALYFVGLFFLPFAASVHGWAVKPVWILAMFGAVPAILIGLLGRRLYLSRREAQKVTERLDAVYAKEDSRLDPALTAAQMRMLRRERWRAVVLGSGELDQGRVGPCESGGANRP